MNIPGNGLGLGFAWPGLRWPGWLQYGGGSPAMAAC